MSRLSIVCFMGIICFAGICFGQDEQENRKGKMYSSFDDRPKLTLFGGSGITEQARPAGSADTSTPRKLVNFGLAFEQLISLELGYLGPADDVSLFDGVFFSSGISAPLAWWRIGEKHFDLPLTFGYTRLIGTGNAVNFGAGLDVFLDRDFGIRFEVRNYLKLSERNEHNLAFRIGLVRRVED